MHRYLVVVAAAAAAHFFALQGDRSGRRCVASSGCNWVARRKSRLDMSCVVVEVAVSVVVVVAAAVEGVAVVEPAVGFRSNVVAVAAVADGDVVEFGVGDVDSKWVRVVVAAAGGTRGDDLVWRWEEEPVVLGRNSPWAVGPLMK